MKNSIFIMIKLVVSNVFGNFSIKLIWVNWIMIGKLIRIFISINKEVNKLKNKNGWLFLNNFIIVIIILKLLEKVFSFDLLFFGWLW